MPITHGYHRHGIDVRRQRTHQTNALPLGQSSYGRTPADLRVTPHDWFAATRRNRFRDRFPQQTEWAERDNVRSQKKVQQEWLNRGQRIWAAKLKHHDAD